MKSALIQLIVLVLVCGAISAIFIYQLNKSAASIIALNSQSFENDVNSVAEVEITPISGCLEMWGGPENLQAIEEGSALELPKSATNITASSVAFMDCSINVSFAMSPLELDSFIETTYVTELVPTLGARLFTGVQPNYDVNWVFEPESTYLYGQGNNGNMEYQSIAVDTSDPTLYLVYVITVLL